MTNKTPKKRPQGKSLETEMQMQMEGNRFAQLVWDRLEDLREYIPDTVVMEVTVYSKRFKLTTFMPFDREKP